ncbi:MAG: NADH-quinone oxidoreductase subunit L, partial [Acidobacteria bacterium]|nr:NADH-quinone oxidoreductase subunit L [Acidobacteriota bacterium]
FIGATGKSAQIPLYVWLPDAMAGPTPVSALIHAATMVTAGVYMVTRSNVIFQKSPTMMFVVAVIGIITAIWAALIAFSQNDIKKVLAYSTISQLGYMFLACGVGAFTAGIFHLYTHAFFKALMFLGAGSVICALHHEQDMQRMGGLEKHLPTTYRTFVAGWLAICGVPIFAGFFSKDEILWRTFSTHQIPGGPAFWLLGLAGALCTAFYMTRLMALTFWGERRAGEGHHDDHGGHAAGHGHGAGAPHESPAVMTLPLLVLAAGAVVSGFIGWPQALGGSNRFEHWLDPVIYKPSEAGGAEHAAGVHDPMEYVLMIASVVLSLAVIFAARTLYLRRQATLEALTRSLHPLYEASRNKFWVDELYDLLFVRGLVLGSSRLFLKVDTSAIDGGVNGSAWLTVASSRISGFFDKYVVDLLVNMIGWISRVFSMFFRAAQTGFAQNYAFIIVSAVFVITLSYLFLR